MSRARHRAKRANPFEPTGVYCVTLHGLELPPDSTDADAWHDLRDIGRRLGCAPHCRETIAAYADRLTERLSQFDRQQRIDGAAVFAFRQIVDLYRRERPGAPPSEPGPQNGV